MEQLMETQVGPRHAKPVTLMGRLKYALNKGPTKWNWKTNLVVAVMFIGVVVGLTIAAAVIAVSAIAGLK